MEQPEPMDVWLVRYAEGYDQHDNILTVLLTSEDAQELAEQEGGLIEPWTLVPSAVRAAEQARLTAFEAAAARVRVDIDGIIPGQAHLQPPSRITRWVHALRGFVGYHPHDNPVAQEVLVAEKRLAAFEALAKRARVMCEYGVTPQVLVSLRDDLATLAPPAPPEGGPE